MSVHRDPDFALICVSHLKPQGTCGACGPGSRYMDPYDYEDLIKTIEADRKEEQQRFLVALRELEKSHEKAVVRIERNRQKLMEIYSAPFAGFDRLCT